jgi:Flp pilus assembly pilin Flp
MGRRTVSGQGLADYAIALAIIAIAIAIVIVALGGNVSKILSNVTGPV